MQDQETLKQLKEEERLIDAKISLLQLQFTAVLPRMISADSRVKQVSGNWRGQKISK